MQVRDYLFSQADLNLTRSDEASVASNVLYMMELLPPPKAAALAYLDSGGQAPLPPRQATPPSSSICTLHALREACSISLREEVILRGSQSPAGGTEALWSLCGNNVLRAGANCDVMMSVPCRRGQCCIWVTRSSPGWSR